MSGDTDASEVSLGGQTISATLARFVAAGVGFLGAILFARILGPVAFGGYYFLFSIAKVADRPLIGWAEAAKKRYSEVDAAHEELVGAVLAISLVWFFLVSIVVIAFRGPLNTQVATQGAAILLILLIISESAFEASERLVDATGKVGISTWTDTARSYLTFPLQLGLVLTGLGATGLALGLAGATFVAVMFLTTVIATTPVWPAITTVRSVWAYARFSVPDAIVGAAYTRFDILIIGLLVSQGTAGIYEAAAKLTLPAVFLSETASRGLMARVSNRASHGADVTTDTSNTIAFSSTLALPLFFGALALATDLMQTIFGGDYAAGGPILITLALARLIQTQVQPLAAVVKGLDKPQIGFRVSAIALVLNIAIGLVLLIPLGAIGVIIATVLSELVSYLLYARAVQRHLSGLSLFPRTLYIQVGSAVVMFGVVEVLQHKIPVKGWLPLISIVSVGAILYFTLLMALSFQFRQTAIKIFRDFNLGNHFST